jgi:uncharacterized LabA/DUF88 family protein
MAESQNLRVAAFVDGQNLFNAAKTAFGYGFPNFDPIELAKQVCNQQSDIRAEHWVLVKLYFYTGMPSPTKDEPRNRFWKAKLAAMGKHTDLVQTFSRPLVYRNGIGQEKGIDVKLAIDAVRLAHESAYEVALIFSQDQDFVEVATEIRRIADVQNRWITVASAFPVSPDYTNDRGIDKTDWIPIDRTLYDQAIDPTNYRSC